MPVFKKGERKLTQQTLTIAILNLTEQILNKRHNMILEKSQSLLQKGFTSAYSSVDAALILSECISKAKNMHKPLILATLVAKKTFDVVDHKILLRTLHFDGIAGENWLVLNDVYRSQFHGEVGGKSL